MLPYLGHAEQCMGQEYLLLDGTGMPRELRRLERVAYFVCILYEEVKTVAFFTASLLIEQQLVPLQQLLSFLSE